MAECKWDKEDRVRATIYGNCIGDAIGLSTEFMTKEDVKDIYGKLEHFEYKDIVRDHFRENFAQGDWTDDSDQMILIMWSLIDKKGKVDPLDFAKRMLRWSKHGIPELGDTCCADIGVSTSTIVHSPNFLSQPHVVAEGLWKSRGSTLAANGGVMRTSILGIHEYWNIEKVIKNTLAICLTTHADPRCQASCVAVTTCIAFMLQGQEGHMTQGTFDINAIMKDSFDLAKKYLSTPSDVTELEHYMFAKEISDLNLDESGKIGYTYKTMGAGFWALRQEDFRAAIETIIREAGDADTNSAVAGALLGCKLGLSGLPDSWLRGLKYKTWLDAKIAKFVDLQPKLMNQPELPEDESKGNGCELS